MTAKGKGRWEGNPLSLGLLSSRLRVQSLQCVPRSGRLREAVSVGAGVPRESVRGGLVIATDLRWNWERCFWTAGEVGPVSQGW